MSYIDKDDNIIFPTRSGPSVGKSMERKMLDAVGGAEGIRRKITATEKGVTTLRTRGGMPHFDTVQQGGEPVVDTFFYAVECSAIGGDGNTYDHVAVSLRGKVKSLSKEKYYDKFAFVNEWVGYNATPGTGLDGHSLRWCGMDQAGGYVGCFRRNTLTSTDSPRWDYSKPLTSSWNDATTVAFAPPGTPLGWSSWGSSGAQATPQFSNEATSSYASLARLSNKTGGGLHGAFKKLVGGVPQTCVLSVGDFSKPSRSAPKTVFGTINNLTAGTSANITFGTPPAIYSQFSYSGRIARLPFVANGEGTRAVAEVYCHFTKPLGGDSDGVCLLDIDLASNSARVLSYPAERKNYHSFGFIDGVLSAAWMLNADPATTGKAAVVGDRVLVRTPAAPGWVDEAVILFADFGRSLFIVRVNDSGYSLDHSIYIVFYQWEVVAKLFVAVSYDGFMTYGAAEIDEDAATGFPSHTTPEADTLAPGSSVDWVTTYSGSSVTFEPFQQPTNGVAYASVDAKGKYIAVSITLNHMQVGNVSEAVAIWNGPRVLNKIIKVSSGATKTFGSSDKFYNRLHFQDEL